MAFDGKLYEKLLPSNSTEDQVREVVALAGGIPGEIEVGTSTLYSSESTTVFKTRRLLVHNNAGLPPVEMIFLGQTKVTSQKGVSREEYERRVALCRACPPEADVPVVTPARQSD